MIRLRSLEETNASLPLPDLTPLLDVVFIVMIFLLFTANVQTLSIPVKLPQATQAEAMVAQQPKTLTVSILAEGSPWAISKKRFDSWAVFSQSLLKQVKDKPDVTVLIAGDKTAPLGHLVKLMMFLGQHKIKAAQVLMKDIPS
ncbi:MAG: biopolymer transporter ExbD [Endozoicomonas sp. (ex Botrylloides leachii)]|nr:biopolymer transporter ExbD [Endozoicomonas sp. (ex Botrylloides leachii)]